MVRPKKLASKKAIAFLKCKCFSPRIKQTGKMWIASTNRANAWCIILCSKIDEISVNEWAYEWKMVTYLEIEKKQHQNSHAHSVEWKIVRMKEGETEWKQWCNISIKLQWTNRNGCQWIIMIIMNNTGTSTQTQMRFCHSDDSYRIMCAWKIHFFYRQNILLLRLMVEHVHMIFLSLIFHSKINAIE